MIKDSNVKYKRTKVISFARYAKYLNYKNIYAETIVKNGNVYINTNYRGA